MADTARLFTAHRRLLVSMADAITRSHAEAEDVVQEAFIRVSGRDAIGVEKPLGYIYTTVRNLALDCRRAAARRSGDGLPELAIGRTMATPEEIAIRREQVRLVRTELEALPSSLRRAVALHLGGGSTLKEMALRLNVSPGHAHRLVRKGMHRCGVRAGWDQDRPAG